MGISVAHEDSRFFVDRDDMIVMLARDGSLGLATMSGWARFAFSALRDALLRPGAPAAAMARSVTGPRVAVAPASGP